MPEPTFLPESKPRRHPDSAFRAVGEEGGLVVLAGRAEVKVLNPVGIRVFALLDGRHTLASIADAVYDEFEIAPEQAAEDVREFVAELAEHGMLAEPSEEVAG